MKKNMILFALLLCITIPVSAANMSEWAEAEFKKATEKKLVPTVLKDADLTQDINRAEFAALSVKLYEALSGTKIKMPAENPFTDTDDREVQKAYAAGITTGIDEGIFGVENPLTREQAATMLTRTYTKSMEAVATTKGETTVFADDANISDWAKESVYFMAENGIINGVGDNMFSPKANCTREQSVAISVRTFDKFVSTEPVSLRNFAPAIDFGTETGEFIEEGNTTIKLTGVTDAEYLAYEKQLRILFPNVNFQIGSGGYGLYYKGDNGTYSGEATYVSGEMTITIKRIDSDF